MKRIVTTVLALIFCLSLTLSLTACGGGESEESGTVYKIGICNYVDDASLNQIVENIETISTSFVINKHTNYSL